MRSEDTVEKISRITDLDDCAVLAQQSKDEAERLIGDFKAFLSARVFRYSTHANETQREEMYGSAMMAFYEAIQKYDASKGHFFPFANKVVCERLIDFNRAMRRRDGFTVSLDAEDEEQGSAQSAAINAISIRNYEAEHRHSQLLDEIEQYKAELATWGLSMASLVSQSPKHDRLREEYKMVIKKIMQTPENIQTIQLKRYFPIKTVSELTGLPQKKLDRARNFLLASLIIKMGDYSYLSEYVSDRR